MPAKKATAKRKAVKKDHVTVTYGTVVFYVLIGLILGMAIGALALLYVLRVQRDTQDTLSTSAQGQVLQVIR
jgi:hypothetical protein